MFASSQGIHMAWAISALVPSVLSGGYSATLPCRGWKDGKCNATSSFGSQAQCVEGLLDVPVTTSNTRLAVMEPQDNLHLAQLFQDALPSGSNYSATRTRGLSPVASTFTIYGKLCVPVANPPKKAAPAVVQLLTHGGTLDATYWDFDSGYSYVNTAAAAGFATFSYDRLGTRYSEHPDPIQIVQESTQTQIAHCLVQKLKVGAISGVAFPKVVGVGHSVGSALTQAVTARYPTDFEAVILTGHSTDFSGANLGQAGTAQQIANTLTDRPFHQLQNGYVAFAPVLQTVSFGFFYYPNYDPKILAKAFQTRETNALGEFFTISAAYAPSLLYTGPVFILNGARDLFFCNGDCNYPDNAEQIALAIYYPNRSKIGSRGASIPETGHDINFHYSANEAFKQMLDFLLDNELQP